jgi:DNA topoisomerase-1
MSLVIVESASKCKTIKKFLGDSYIVTFSAGHICDLPKDELGIDTNSWIADYKVTNKKIVDNIRNQVKKCNTVYIASDPDIEGEAIAFHIYNHIHDLLRNRICHRIRFNEITKKVIIDAIKNPSSIDMNIVEAQETRRMADRLIGYKLSPLLWSKFNNNYLSAGRVQFAALIMCINQRNKILNKEIIPHWTIQGDFKIKCISLLGILYNENKIWKFYDENDLIKKMEYLELNKTYSKSYTESIKRTSPYPPFTTTSMQQEAYNKLRFSSKYTMKLAQTLYEHGYITYMRTDSTHISDDAKWKILNYIKREYGEDNAKFRVYKTRVANAQEAHEAIRITNPDVSEISFEGCIEDHNKLYKLIWKRTLASLMSDAEYTEFVIKLFDKNNDDDFRCTQSFLIKKGFYLVYEPDRDCEDYSEFQKTLDDDSSKITCKKFIANAEIDNIPSMFNEVQLIKELEKEGIGRPSTYATIIDKLFAKKYVERGMNPQQQIEIKTYEKTKKGVEHKSKQIHLGGKQKDLLIPTELGISCIEYIYHCAEYLCDLKFTAKLEKDMDDIMQNLVTKKNVLNDLHNKIMKTLKLTDHTSVKQSQDTNKKTGKKSGIIQSKYGCCYYDKDTNKYTNIESYMKWQKKTMQEITDKDILFIRSLPKKIKVNDSEYNLHLGKYGLYLKDMYGANAKLDKKLWSHFL